MSRYSTEPEIASSLEQKVWSQYASLIYSFCMWVFGVVLILIYGYLWPDIISNIWQVGFIVTMTMAGFYWQNKKLLEDLDSDSPLKKN